MPVPADKPEPSLLKVDQLRTWFETDTETVRAVDGVSFQLRRGERLGLVGESGSGKSVCAKSLIRLLDPPARIVGGSIEFAGRDLLALSEDEICDVRGRDIAMVFQDPMTSLNPVRRIGAQLIEAMTAHRTFTNREAKKRAVDLLRRMGVPAPERALRSYPHQFSGGMRQRVMLAMGIANNPAVIIADEPTTALDVTIQAQILDLLREVAATFGTAVIIISHDLGVIANICTRVLVMYAGEIVEEGPPEQLLTQPRHPYTWALLHAAPRMDGEIGNRRIATISGQPPDPRNWPTGCRFRARCPFAIEKCAEHPELLPVGEDQSARCWVTQAGASLAPPILATSATTRDAGGLDPILVLKGLQKRFPLAREGFFGPRPELRAVDGVDLQILRGETLGLVGESGCGKSTLARLVTRLYEPTAGQIIFDGHDISHMSAAEMRPLRRRIQMIFQDPFASLNPRMRVGEILTGPLLLHDIVPDHSSALQKSIELLNLVGLPATATDRFPHEFSGGQRQRISIARALAVGPEFLVADEPISALDVNIQGQILRLMVDLQDRLGLTYLFIAHDLAVVRQISDRVVVMYLGRVVEIADPRSLFGRPLHPYTAALISAAPVPDPHVEQRRRRVPLIGEPPSPINVPSGCRFRTRCPAAQTRCVEEDPLLREVEAGQLVACHFPGSVQISTPTA